MDKNSREAKLYRSWRNLSSSLLKDNEEADELFLSLKNGKNTYRRLDRIESSSFDLSWIERIEDALPDLGTIINNPRRNTKEVQNLVPVELVRKVNAETVQHLASHTAYIKSIAENGDVIPSKLLNIGTEDDLHTYENRFVATLIRRLVLFVEKRYEYVKTFGELKHHEILSFKNESDVNGKKVNIETKVTVITPKKDPEAIKSNDYIERIKLRREYILYYYNSPFRRELKTEKNVRAPILQTNIIRKNPLYHKCYELFLFLASYNRLGVGYSVKEDFALFDGDDIARLNVLRLANYLALQGKDRPEKVRQKQRVYQPTIVTSMDDEAFVFGPLHQGPISFVRIDSSYLNFRKEKADVVLPNTESETERAYYLKDYQDKEKAQKEYRETRELLKRKEKDQLIFDEVTKQNREREKKKEREARRAFYRQRAKEEQEYLDAFRQSIVKAAKEFRVEHSQSDRNRDNRYPSNCSPFEYLTYCLHKGEEFSLEKVIASTYQDTKNLLSDEEEETNQVSYYDRLTNRLYDYRLEEDEAKEETVVEEGKQKIEEKGPFSKISLFGEAKRKEYIVALKDHTFYQKENTFTTKEEEAHVFSFYKEAKAISRVYHGKVLGR